MRERGGREGRLRPGGGEGSLWGEVGLRKFRPAIGRNSQATTLSRPGCLAGRGRRFKLTHSGSRLAGRGSTCSLSLL